MLNESPFPAYRCTVVPEQSAASLRLGWKNYPTRVIDTSRDAFTLQVDAQVFRKVKEGTRGVLEYHGEVWEVECAAVFRLMDDQYHISMLRRKDLTHVQVPKSSLWSIVPRPTNETDPVLPMALLVSFLFACVALPGMGDSLGTAPKIRKAIQDVWQRATRD